MVGNASALRRQYAGCQVGTTLVMPEPSRPRVGGFGGPTRSWDIVLESSTRADAAVAPSANTLPAPVASTSESRRPRHADTAAFGGVALPGGRHRVTLVNATSFSLKP